MYNSINIKKIQKLFASAGFTIIELLICIVIFSVILLITTQSIIIVTRKSGLARLRSETDENARFVIETLKRQLRETSSLPGNPNNNLDCPLDYCAFSTSSTTQPVPLMFCLQRGVVIKYTYPIGAPDSTHNCNALATPGVTVDNVSNSSIMFVKSLQFIGNTSSNTYFNISIEYTDIKGTLCKTSSPPGTCTILSSAVVVRTKKGS